jgi:GNAT superfamily N-acetyltransferase
MNTSAFHLSIELLDGKRHDRSSFDCGVPALNNYLQRQAGQDMEKNAAVVYVAVIEPPAVAGYYSLSQFSIDLVHLPEAIARRLPRYPVLPATLLGRLAISLSQRGRRLGETLLFDALYRSQGLSAQIASVGVVVDAKDENAQSFYRRYGFVEILDAGRRMFVPMKTIRQMF